MANNVKILIADDSSFMRNVIKGILQKAGFSNFAEAADGQEATQKIADEQPGLILLDIIMPLKTGLEVLESVGAKIPVIMISAVGQEGIIAEAKAKGAKGYIVKPFDSEQVLKEVKQVLGS